MSLRSTIAVAVVLVVGVASAEAQWAPPRCDLKPGHYLVNSGVLYLRNAARTRYEEQKQKDLQDADRVLTQAVTSGGQEDNGAAWYYLARRYVMVADLEGADSAFAKAAALAPQCAEDIQTWRRQLWTPIFNRGVEAYQAGVTDSAVYYFKRANVVLREPNGLSAIASLYANAREPDSAARYFAAAAQVAQEGDTLHMRLRREALFNRGAVYNQHQRWTESEAAFKAFLEEYPGDVQALAGLASAYAQTGRQQEALAAYRELAANAASAEPRHLHAAGVAMFNAAPPEPDSAAVAQRCREAKRPTGRVTPAQTRQIAAECAAAARDSLVAHRATSTEFYRGAAGAFEAGLARGGPDRDALYNLANTYYRLADTTKTLDAARRLYAIDPMNRTTLRLLAAAWQINGRTDSTLRYLQLADSALTAEVTVSAFTLSDQGATMTGMVTSLLKQPGTPFTLVFEFVDSAETVVGSQDVQVPALEPGMMHAFEVGVVGRGIVAWRYRKR
jgi:cytochrome c-type biogenesis protein CcmH/NrfG